MKKLIIVLVLFISSFAFAETRSVNDFELYCISGKWVYPSFRGGQKMYISDNAVYTSFGVGRYIRTEGLYTPFSFNGKVYTITHIPRELGECLYQGDMTRITLIEGVNRFDVNQDGVIDYSDLTELMDKIGELQ